MFLFFLGVGIGARRRRGKTLTYALGEDGIDVLQPRHRVHLPWSRVRRVEEVDGFFVLATDLAAFSIPRRARPRGPARGLRRARKLSRAPEVLRVLRVSA